MQAQLQANRTSSYDEKNNCVTVLLNFNIFVYITTGLISVHVFIPHDTMESVVCWLLNIKQHGKVSQGWIYLDSCACCHTQKLHIKLPISPRHSILTPGQPVLAMALKCWAPARVSTRVSFFHFLSDLFDSTRKKEVRFADLLLLTLAPHHYVTKAEQHKNHIHRDTDASRHLLWHTDSR